jgi:hypothetical protein
METDMHRVIRTQDLSDDHAQVKHIPCPPAETTSTDDYSESLSPHTVLYLPNPSSAQGIAQRRRYPP